MKMSKIPSELRKKAGSPEVDMRVEAAGELRDYSGPESLTYLKEMLSDDNSEVVYTASRSLVSMGSPAAIEEIISLLRSEDPRLCNLAIELIGRIGSVAIPRVIELLDDHKKDIRKFAVDILMRMSTVEAEEPLIRALFDENVNVAIAAAEALGRIGTQIAVTYLVQCLEKEPWLRCAVLKSLGEIGGEAALKAILATGGKAENMVLFSAVTALESIGDSRSIDFLVELLENGNASLEPSIVQAMASILKSADADTIEKMKGKLPAQRIITLLRSDDTDVVRSAIVLLGLSQIEEAGEHLLQLYNESHERLSQELEEALLRIKPDKLEAIVNTIENENKSETAKIAAIRLLGQMGKKEAYGHLFALLSASEDEVKKEIILALAALKDRRALTILHALLGQDTPDMKETTIEALEAFGDKSTIPHLIKLSTEPLENIRSKAARSLNRRYDLKENKEDISDLLRKVEPEIISCGLDMIPETLCSQFVGL